MAVLQEHDEDLERSREARRLPYDADEWQRRLAEARAKRETALKHQARPRPRPAIAALADPQDDDPDGLADVHAVFLRHALTGGPHHHRAEDARPDPNPRDRSGTIPARRRPLMTLLAGCVLGASLTALVVVGVQGVPQKAPLSTAAPPARSAATPGEADKPALAARTPPAEVVPTDPAPQIASADPVPEPETESSATEVGADIIPEVSPEAAAMNAESEPEADVEFVAAEANSPTAPETLPEEPSPQPPATAAASIERVIVNAPPSVAGAARDETTTLLREAGWPADDARTSPFTIRETHVRYYHPEDQAAAEELAALFSASARDFTDYSPSPGDGMIELWLAGRAPTHASTRGRPPPDPARMLANALNRLAAALNGPN
jgi:hypothetical protein